MNRVSDNSFWYTHRIGSLVYTTFNDKEFSFYAINVESIIKSFDYKFVTNMNMRYRYCYIVLNTCISDN